MSHSVSCGVVGYIFRAANIAKTVRIAEFYIFTNIYIYIYIYIYITMPRYVVSTYSLNWASRTLLLFKSIGDNSYFVRQTVSCKLRERKDFILFRYSLQYTFYLRTICFPYFFIFYIIFDLAPLSEDRKQWSSLSFLCFYSAHKECYIYIYIVIL